MSQAQDLRKAIAALRSGRAVRIEGDPGLTVSSVETTTAELLDLVDPARAACMLISGERAEALALANRIDAADPAQPVLLNRPDWLSVEDARAIADPGRDLDRAPLGPLQPLPIASEQTARAALRLSRLAGLLPALWVLEHGTAAVGVSAEDALGQMTQAEIIARARLPLENLPDAQIAAFRASDDGEVHVALVVGAFGGADPLVRLHSECLTGDVFGSLKCDCGPQLREALRIIGEEGGGVLLYLRQEGRGIGIGNKLRAYALQDRGLDTVEANQRLGFADDERSYAHAAAILRALGITRVRLLTNNPAKVDGLAAAGIGVAERVAHHMPTNPHNADYVTTKQIRSGHLP